MNNIVITLDTINSLTPTQVVRNESVRLKFIDVYDTIWGEGTGEPAYEREANYFNSQIRDKEELRKCTSFSIFTSFIDLAVCGLSLEPGSRALCYLIPRSYKTSAKDGKDLWEKRAKLTISGYGELVLRARAGQIRHADNPVLVYEGDTFSFSDVDGRKTVNYTCNLPHTSSHIIAAYLRITRTDGTQDFSVMLEEDWNRLAEYSKKNNSYYDKSGQKVEKVNELYRSSNGDIDPGFLCAKLIKHAFKTYPKVRIGKAVLESEEKAAAEVDIENFYNIDGAPENAPDAGNAPADNTSAQDGAPVPATDHNDETF